MRSKSCGFRKQEDPLHRFIALDVDGTLLNSSGEISPGVFKSLQDAQSAGMLVTILSGRTRIKLLPLIAQLGISMPYSGSNGGFIAIPGKNSLIAHTPISPQAAAWVIDIAQKENLSGICFKDVDWSYYDESGFAWMQNVIPRAVLYSSCLKLHDLSKECPAPTKIDLMGDADRIQAVHCRIQREQPALTVLPGMNPNLLELTKAGVNKGVALEKIASILKIPLSDTVAVGDGANDVGMFQIAGCSIAMGNALPEVRSAAHLVAPSNLEDGLVWVMETLRSL